MPKAKRALLMRNGHKAEITVREITPGCHVILLPEGASRWGSFGIGLILEIVGIAALVLIPILFPQNLENFRNYWTTSLESPVIQPWHPKPRHKFRMPDIIREPASQPVHDNEASPKVYSPVASSPVTKRLFVKRSNRAPEIASAIPNQPLPLVVTEIPNLRKPREEVRLAGFGAGSGVEQRASGNQGVIASSGFGNSADAGTEHVAGNHGAIREGVFGAQIGATVARAQRAVTVSAKTSPVQILYKPRPSYTEDARVHRIEGDVILQVLFTASGEVQVESVLRGLGHGLDDSAIAAARKIRFRPAESDGQPKDFAALVHITFELAY